MSKIVAFFTTLTAADVFAVAVAIWALLKSDRTARQSLKLEMDRDKAEDLNEKRAAVIASLVVRANAPTVQVENMGKGLAMEIYVTLHGDPIGQYEWNLTDGPPRLWPITLSPSAIAYFPLKPGPDSIDLSPVVVKWEDGSGDPGHWESDL